MQSAHQDQDQDQDQHSIVIEDHSATCSCGWSFRGLDPLDRASTHILRAAA